MKSMMNVISVGLVAAGLVGCGDDVKNVSELRIEDSNIDVSRLQAEGRVTVSAEILPELLVAARMDRLTISVM